MKRAKTKRSTTQKRAKTRSRSATRGTTRKTTARRPTSKRKPATRAAAKRKATRSTRTKAQAVRSRKKVTARKTTKRAASKSTARKKTTRKAPARAKTPTRQIVSRARRSSTSHLVRPLKRRRKKLIPSPLPKRHIAPPPPPLLLPARSMPPMHEQVGARDRLSMAFADFAEAGVMLSISYSIRDGRRQEFFDLMKELKPLLGVIGGADCTVYEDRSRPNYFMEVFRFKDESEFTAFDDKFHKDRKIAAVYSLLDDIVEAEKSDFKIFERKV